MDLQTLIADAELSFGFSYGSGLGAIVLGVVAIVFLLTVKPTSLRIMNILRLLRSLDPREGRKRVSKSQRPD